MLTTEMTDSPVQWSRNQWRGPKNGATVGALMAAAYYPLNEDQEAERIRTSVRLPIPEHERVAFLADLWNALDKASGKKRAKKWKAASVIERLVSVGLDGFAGQIGGWPESKAERAEMIKRASEVIDRLKK